MFLNFPHVIYFFLKAREGGRGREKKETKIRMRMLG